MRHPNEQSGGNRYESFDFSEHNLEGLNISTTLGKVLQGVGLGGARRAVAVRREASGRQDGHVSRQMGQIGMEFPAKVFYELSQGILDVSHQGVMGTLHGRVELYADQRAE